MEVEYKVGPINEVLRNTASSTVVIDATTLIERNQGLCLVPHVYGVYQRDHRLEEQLQKMGIEQYELDSSPKAIAFKNAFFSYANNQFMKHFREPENLPSDLISILYEPNSMPREAVRVFLEGRDISRRIGIFSLDEVPDYTLKMERDFGKVNHTVNHNQQEMLNDPEKKKRMINYIEKYAEELDLDRANFGLTMTERSGLAELKQALSTLRGDPKILGPNDSILDLSGIMKLIQGILPKQD